MKPSKGGPTHECSGHWGAFGELQGMRARAGQYLGVYGIRYRRELSDPASALTSIPRPPDLAVGHAYEWLNALTVHFEAYRLDIAMQSAVGRCILVPATRAYCQTGVQARLS